MIDTSGGSDTVVMVRKVLEWSGKDFDREEWREAYEVYQKIKEILSGSAPE